MRFLSTLAMAVFVFPAVAADPPKQPAGKVSYYNDIRPIFQQNCQGCHQPARAQGGYIMTSYADLLKPGDRDKKGIVPGKPQESFLFEEIRIVNGKAEMPKAKDPLPDFQIKMIEKWIIEGAIDDTPESAKAPLVDEAHPPTYESLPTITTVAYSPDGSLIAVSGYHEVVLHKSDGSGIVGRLIGLSERIQSLAFSPDGKLLAVSGGDPARFGEIQVWDVEKRKLKFSVPATFDTVYGVSWSPDGSKIAFGGADNAIRAIDATNGKQVLYQGAHSDWVLGTSFSQDGKHLVSVSRDRSVKLTEVETQRFIDNVTSITPGALKGGLLALEVRPAKPASYYEALDHMNKILKTIPMPKHAEPYRIKTPQHGARFAFTPSDTPGAPPKLYDEILTAGADGRPRLYKMHREVKRVIGDDANRIREFEQMPGRIYALNFSRDGGMFAAGSSLDGTGEVRIFETESGKRISQLEKLSTPIYSVSIHPNGEQIVSGGADGILRLHDVKTGKLIKEFAPVTVKK